MLYLFTYLCMHTHTYICNSNKQKTGIILRDGKGVRFGSWEGLDEEKDKTLRKLIKIYFN